MLGRLRFFRSEQDDPLLKEAVEAMQRHGCDPVWVEGEMGADDRGCIYVLENFDTPEYKTLAGKCRVVGPAVVIAHLKHGWPLPASNQPVFSTAMHGVVACFTQLGSAEKRKQLSKLVSLMGGKVQGDFTRHITHLIAGQVGSTKYNVARKFGLPVLLPSWVEACWEEGLRKEVCATEERLLSSHRCPPLTGCTITVTGLDERERSRVRELCQGAGGTYTGELTKDICTHLLVGNKSSAKYKYARQWKMYCVVPQWFYDSVETGYCQSEEVYDVDVSPEGRGEEPQGKRGARGRDTEEEEEVPEWRRKLSEFTVPTEAASCFLDGCKIYFTGFSEDQLEKLHRIVNLGGGARFAHPSSSLSHVVMGEQEPSVVATLKELGHSPHVVSALWLLDSCSSGERALEERYCCLQLQPHPSPLGHAPGRQKRRWVESQEEGEGQATKRACLELGDEEDLIQQYQEAVLPPPPSAGAGIPSGVLAGRQLSVSTLFTPEDRQVAVSVVRDHGGELVAPPAGDYHISPLDVGGAKAVSEEGCHTTMIWLQRSIEAATLLDPASYFLFQPVATPLSRTTLSGCVLAFSQFSDLEREHLVRFSKGLGAVVQDHFARYPAHGLLATTHLVLRQPEGDKYHFALKWGIPAVADSWLFDCAKAQKIVPVDDHLIRPATPDQQAPETSQTGVGGPNIEQARLEEMRGMGGQALQDDSESQMSMSSFKPKFDVQDALEMIPAHEPGPNTQLAAIFTEGMQHALVTVEKAEEEVGRREGVLEGVVLCVSKKLAAQKAQLHNLAGSLGADCHWAFDESCTHYIYQGKASEASRDREVRAARESECLIVSPHWITACVESGCHVDESLYPHTYNPSMALSGILTHKQTLPQTTQCKDRAIEKSPEQGGSAAVVKAGPPCEPKEPLSSPTEKSPKSLGPSTSQEEEAMEEEGEEGMEVEEGSGEQPASDAAEVARKFQQHLDEILEAPQEQRRRRSKRLLKKGEEEEPHRFSRPPVGPAHHTTPRAGRNRRGRRTRKKEEQLTESQISDSQLLQVTYDDPEGRREKAKLMARIEREEELKAQGLDPRQFRDPREEHQSREIRLILPPDQPQSDTALAAASSGRRGRESAKGASERLQSTRQKQDRTGANLAQSRVQLESANDGDLPSSTPLPPPLNVPIVTHTSKASTEVQSLYDDKTIQTRSKVQTPPRFLLSSLEQREKMDYGALVQELGGVHIDLDYFTTKCTHLVVGKASRTEKYLGACAAGKWVMHKSYLEACRAARRFVEEEPHEWGVAVGGAEVHPLEAAPRRWRLKLAEQQKELGESDASCGAFQGWRVLLFAERNKMSGLKRLLEAGGAKVIPTNKLTAGTLKEITHAFINMNHFPKQTLSLEQLVHGGVHCLKPDYIAEYLSKGAGIPLEASYLPEVKSLLQRYTPPFLASLRDSFPDLLTLLASFPGM